MENDTTQAISDNKNAGNSRSNFVTPELCNIMISLFFISLLYISITEINILTGIVNNNRLGKIVIIIFKKFSKSKLYSVTKYKNLIVLVIHTMEVITNKTNKKYFSKVPNKYFL
jgi:hypothetical protein